MFDLNRYRSKPLEQDGKSCEQGSKEQILLAVDVRIKKFKCIWV